MSYVLMALGGLICITNFSLSFVRPTLTRAIGKSRDQYRWVSGIPLLGTVLVAIGWGGLDASTNLGAVALILMLIDTGGPHWFLAVMIAQIWRRRVT